MYLLLLLAALVASAVAAPSTHIVEGTEAQAHSHPYIGSLQNGILGIIWSHICGCSLIAENYCLTAAHCVDGSSANSLRVLLGKHNIQGTDNGQQTINVAQIIMHPNYNGNANGYPNDIALLRLSSSATLSETVQTIALAEFGEEFDNTDVIISGWGRTTGGGSSAERLQEVTMSTITNTDCSSRWNDIAADSIFNTHVCVFQPPASACNGDSGGPMTYRQSGQPDKLIGITSWGISGCGGNYPSVYTRVSEFRSWITSNTL